MPDIKRVHLCISGIVQGVFFRAHACEIARHSGLKGWVKNLPDGRVEIVAQGAEDKIHEFMRWCQKGPPDAAVEEVEVQWQDVTDTFDNFEIKYRS